ncbi:MAG: hypothetical protein WC601_11690, partial [Desulfotomaculaceae bacterium]
KGLNWLLVFVVLECTARSVLRLDESCVSFPSIHCLVFKDRLFFVAAFSAATFTILTFFAVRVNR